jgi:hypothetical protein
MSKNQYTTFALRIPPKLRDELKESAIDQEKTQTQVILDALREHLDKKKETKST